MVMVSFVETDIEFRIISATNFNGNAYQVLSMVSKSKIEFASTESCHLIRSQFSSKQRCMCCALSPGPVVQLVVPLAVQVMMYNKSAVKKLGRPHAGIMIKRN